MKHFRSAIIATAVTVTLVIVLGLAAITWVHNQEISNRQKEQRAAALGSGLATVMCLVIGPFWIAGAYRFGRERRASR